MLMKLLTNVNLPKRPAKKNFGELSLRDKSDIKSWFQGINHQMSQNFVEDYSRRFTFLLRGDIRDKTPLQTLISRADDLRAVFDPIIKD